jgi:hypothetical protein
MRVQGLNVCIRASKSKCGKGIGVRNLVVAGRIG